MKKRFILFLSILFVLVSIGLCSCGGVNSYREERYDRADDYQIGNFSFSTDSIKEIEIDWGPRDVRVLNSTSSTSKVEETGTLEDDERLHYLIEGSKLIIKFWKSGMRSNVKRNTKELTIEVPQGASLEIDTVSGDVSGQDLILNYFDFSSTSGDIEFTRLECSHFTVETVSGNTDIEAMLGYSSTFETTSGDVTINFAGMTFIEYETVSGNGDFTFKNGSGLRIEYDTVSGDFTTNLDYQKTGNAYLIGNGEIQIQVESTSGDLKISLTD